MYIAIEGIDGSGKTTLANFLAKKLGATLVCEPPKEDPFWTILRREKLSPTAKLEVMTWLRRNLVNNVVLPILRNGNKVISDRCYVSSFVYQGHIEGIDIREIYEAHEGIYRYPDHVFILDVEPEEALSNLRLRGDELSEYETLEKLRLARNGYYEFFRKNHSTFLVKTPDEVLSIINRLY